MPQLRAAASNAEGEDMDNGTGFFTAKFASGVPSNFMGSSLWRYGFLADGEWTTWGNWPYK